MQLKNKVAYKLTSEEWDKVMDTLFGEDVEGEEVIKDTFAGRGYIANEPFLFVFTEGTNKLSLISMAETESVVRDAVKSALKYLSKGVRAEVERNDVQGYRYKIFFFREF